jgi:hypothetical protein
MQELIRKRPDVVSTPVGYTGGDANATYRNHGTHAEAIEITFDPMPHRLPDARMSDGRDRRFGHRPLDAPRSARRPSG